MAHTTILARHALKKKKAPLFNQKCPFTPILRTYQRWATSFCIRWNLVATGEIRKWTLTRDVATRVSWIDWLLLPWIYLSTATAICLIGRGEDKMFLDFSFFITSFSIFWGRRSRPCLCCSCTGLLERRPGPYKYLHIDLSVPRRIKLVFDHYFSLSVSARMENKKAHVNLLCPFP